MREINRIAATAATPPPIHMLRLPSNRLFCSFMCSPLL